MDIQAKPLLAILGRPNVGKSTLFNRLTKTRNAIVAGVPGVTRDIQYGVGKLGDAAYLVADSGGISSQSQGPLDAIVSDQALGILSDARAAALIVDAREGLNSEDEYIAATLRKSQLEKYLVVNKIDDSDPDLAVADFHRLGLGTPIPISALSGHGVADLVELVTTRWPRAAAAADDRSDDIRVAVVGRPNVGKSTLVNRMFGTDRMITSDLPGTTHDSIAVEFERRGRKFTLIDTAGIRRRARVTDTVEKFSVVKSLTAIDLAAVVVVVLDAHQGIADQDASLLGLVVDSGRSVVIAINKWDGIDADQRARIRRELDRKLKFIDYARRVFISALHGSGVGGLFTDIEKAWRSSRLSIKTSAASDLLQNAVSAHPPPMVRGRRIKLRYAHVGGQNPPTIIVHGNQTESLPDPYRRYLANYFREALNLVGTPVRIEFKRGHNPYGSKRNVLTQRQIRRKRRLMRHVKGRR